MLLPGPEAPQYQLQPRQTVTSSHCLSPRGFAAQRDRVRDGPSVERTIARSRNYGLLLLVRPLATNFSTYSGG